jgi:hypothetical protein
MISASQPGAGSGPPEPGSLVPDGYDVGSPPPARRRLANGTAIAAALIGVPFAAAFVFLAVEHHLSAFGGIAWNFAGALGLPALGVTAAVWSWRRLSRARQQPRSPGSPPAPG